MFTAKISFKINSVSIPQDLYTNSIFLCLEIDHSKFYSVSQKKINNSAAKFYGQTVQVQTPRQNINIAIIDISNKASLKLLKRISLKKNDLFSKRATNHSIKIEGFELKFQSKIVSHNKQEECQTQTSFQDSQFFEDETVDLYKNLTFKKTTTKVRKNSTDSNSNVSQGSCGMKRSRKYSQGLTDCCTPVYKDSGLYQF